MSSAHRHLLGISELSAADIALLLDAAEKICAGLGSSPLLEGRVIVNVFYENSTRTLLSFELAGKRLGAHVLNMGVERSSVAKGETLIDTARTLAAIGADAIVLRHPQNGAPAQIAVSAGCAVINAGDGTNEHPTQALVDALTLRRRFGRIEGLSVAICGDILHSRVARSNMLLLTKMGAKVRMTGPSSLLPETPPPPGVSVNADMEEAIGGADAVIMLRVQHERMPAKFELAPADYHSRYGLTHERLRLAAPHAVVMHPGPINRGVEISAELAADPVRSTIFDQVALGAPVRMACLSLLLEEQP